MIFTSRLRQLLGRRSVLLALALTLAAAVGSAFLPLARVPGYESALLATLFLVYLGGTLGLAAARLDAKNARAGRSWQVGSARSTLAAFGAALVVGALTLGAWIGAAFAGAALGSTCSPTLGLGWYLVLPLPTLALAAATGLLLGYLVPRGWMGGLLYALVVLGSLALSLLPLWRGPQVFFYDHFFGHVPGPIYDDFVRIGPQLLAFRGLTLAWTVAALGGAMLLRRRIHVGIDGSAFPALALSVVALLAVHWGHAHRHRLGYEQSTAAIEEALGGRREGERCVLVHPREARAAEVERLHLQCERRMEELGRFFGVDPGRAHVFLHRSAAEKSRLVGAARTQFAKPWLGQVHVDRRGFPHPVLDHELAHVVTARVGRAPFGVAATVRGLVPLPGLIEGAAVAADWPGGQLSVHEEARAMRDLGLAPDLTKILHAAGFWSQPAARAYTYAGSFIRWLIETRGPESFARAYRNGDFAAAYGMPLADLVAAWETFLDRLHVPPEARALAEARLRAPSIFGQVCARELAALRDEANRARAEGDPLRAAEIFGRILALAPHDANALWAQASALAAADDVDTVWRLAEQSENAAPSIRGRLWVLAGDVLADVDRERALLAYERAAAHPLAEADARGLLLRREAAADPTLAAAALPYLREGAMVDLFAVREVLAERPDWGAGWYLVGRRLHLEDRHAAASSALDRALAAGLPPQLEREARTLRALSRAWEGDAAGCIELDALADEGTEGRRIEAAKLASLCRAALER